MKFFSTIAALVLALGGSAYAQSPADLTPTEYRNIINAYNNQTSTSTLILSGTEVPRGTRQYLGGVRLTRGGKTFCGSSLIAPDWVLTAAHCDDNDVNFVAVGAHLVSGTRDGQIIEVVERIPHPKNNRATDNYDFLLLRLARPVQGIQPVALAASDQSAEAVGTVATVMGWGRTAQGGVQSNVRLGVDVTIWDNKRCGTNLKTSITKAMLCAGGEANKDSCQNDSGGPLVVKRGGNDVLVGVVSWGKGCGVLNMPGVYARVSAARDFIDEHVAAARWL
ncbi:hypothetical protein P43SY_008672 [Pythium insidiosum]|uniref:Peptidase S1 domain-containing protein n=1 Tax=Pythium insidiosum TaxID=114742 RepID=A0AAD5LHT7_PYTIN|nr:hypothetical protein P43SY_008672 [Pythium insidiosum]